MNLNDRFSDDEFHCTYFHCEGNVQKSLDCVDYSNIDELADELPDEQQHDGQQPGTSGSSNNLTIGSHIARGKVIKREETLFGLGATTWKQGCFGSYEKLEIKNLK